MGASSVRWSVLLLLLGPISPSSVTPGDVVISEVAWMGTAANSAHEWIELYNNTTQAINLNGWRIVSLTDNSPNFTISSANCSNLTIPAKGFFLLERTSNSTVSDIAADCIYTGALSDTGEALALRDPSNNTIDTANGDGGAWPAGTTSPRATMERIALSVADSDANWDTNDGVHRNGLDANNNPINGTPKAPRQRASFNALDVVISEVAWMGTAADANDEWIELYNTTNQSISLAGWRLVAADGTPTIAFSSAICSNLVIPAQGFLLLERTDDTTVSDITADCIYTGALSNSGEALSLKDPSNNIIDTGNSDGGPWPAGHDTATMERLDLLTSDSDSNWATNNQIHRNGLDAKNNPINGTPKAHKPPYVTLLSPTTTAPAYRRQGDSLTVSFTTDEAGAYTISVDSSPCDTGSVSSGSHTKICPLPANIPEGPKTLTIAITDQTAILGSSSQADALIVDNTPPTVRLLTPNGGETLPAQSVFTVTWELCSDLHLGTAPIQLLYSTDSGVSFPTLITAATENDGSFIWNLPTINSHTVRVRIICSDLAGNSAQDDSDANFTIASFTVGDVNDDGKINTLDARMAQQHADGVITLTGNQFLAADVDQDSDIDSHDATAIAKKGIGLPTGIPGFALEPHPQPLSVNGEGWPQAGVRWLFLAFTLPALALLRRHRRLAILLLVGGLSVLTGCVEFAGLAPPSGAAIYLTSTSMPNGATRTIDLIVQQITAGGGLASLQGRITFPAGVAIQSVTGLGGFIVKALCGTVGDPCPGPNELRLSLVKPSAGGVSNGAILRLEVSASGGAGQVYTLSWAGSVQAPIVLGSDTNIEITGFVTGNGQVKVQ
ncbi:MAG: lamin tail domain-containing protein [Candidatus Bipolaricaulota bacterium]|nr:lamin tail domain-containing protein [Candidatus Bipolaricaulota bacterium]